MLHETRLSVTIVYIVVRMNERAYLKPEYKRIHLEFLRFHNEVCPVF